MKRAGFRDAPLNVDHTETKKAATKKMFSRLRHSFVSGHLCMLLARYATPKRSSPGPGQSSRTSRLRADKIEDDKRERQRFHAKPDPMSAA
jgi:hypothetical protein